MTEIPEGTLVASHHYKDGDIMENIISTFASQLMVSFFPAKAQCV